MPRRTGRRIVYLLAVFLQLHLSDFTKLKQTNRNRPDKKHITTGRLGGGVFFERKRRKKAHRMGRPVPGTKPLKPRQLRVTQLPTSHQHLAVLGAALQRWNDFAGVEQTAGVERAFHAKHLLVFSR